MHENKKHRDYLATQTQLFARDFFHPALKSKLLWRMSCLDVCANLVQCFAKIGFEPGQTHLFYTYRKVMGFAEKIREICWNTSKCCVPKCAPLSRCPPFLLLDCVTKWLFMIVPKYFFTNPIGNSVSCGVDTHERTAGGCGVRNSAPLFKWLIIVIESNVESDFNSELLGVLPTVSLRRVLWPIVRHHVVRALAVDYIKSPLGVGKSHGNMHVSPLELMKICC